MPLIPPISVQATEAADSFASGNHNVVLAFPSSVTQGNLLIASLGGLVPEGGSDTYTINSISDTLTDNWSQIFIGTFTTGTAPNRNFWTTALWFAFAKSTGANTVTFNVSGTGGFSKTQLPNVAEWKNVALNGFDQAVSGSGSTNPISTGAILTSQNNELAINQDWFTDGGINFGSAPPNTGCQFVGILSPGSPSRPVLASNVGPAETGISCTGTNNNSKPAFVSLATFFCANAADPANGNVFFRDYPQMTWMKNVFILARDYWDQGLSSPYVGQLYPSPNTGGAQSGQTHPF